MTSQKKYLQSVPGIVTNIISHRHAEIQFKLDGNVERAFLDKNRFYYNARLIPYEEPLDKYIRLGTEVTFSCRSQNPVEEFPFKWFVLLCYRRNHSLGSNVTISEGWVHSRGSVFSLTKRHGVLIATDAANNEHKVYFLASKVYLYGKRFPCAKSLCSELSIDDNVFFDAIPCIPNLNEDNCKWFATCVFKGQKPVLTNERKPAKTNVEQLLNIVYNCFNNPRTVFLHGRGIIFKILTEEVGIILADFQYNIYRQVLFHRKNAFVFGMCLSNAKLTEIFKKGDRVKFVCTGTPPNLIIGWIALQVAVCDFGEYVAPNINPQICMNNRPTTHETNSLN